MVHRLPDNRLERLQAAVALHQEGRLEAARAAYAGLLSEAADDFNALHLLGLVHHQMGDPSRAIPLIERALALNPRDPAALSNLGLALSAAGRLDEACAVYDRALALRPDDAETRLNRALALRRQGRLEAALIDLDHAAAVGPAYAEAHLVRGEVLLAMGRADAACAALNTGISLAPLTVDAYVNLAAALHSLGRHEDAVGACDVALILDPSHAEGRLNRGVALQALGRFGEMLEDCERALATRAGFGAAHLHRGLALKALGRYEEALAAFDQALVTGGAPARALTEKGVVLEALGRTEEALLAHEAALRDDADLADAHCNLGVVLHRLGRHGEALSSYDRALARAPRDADAWTHRAVVLEKLGRTDEALASYAAAVEHDPHFARAYVNRAHLLLSLGAYAEGWSDYEWRKRSERPVGDRSFPKPALGPEASMEGRTVLVHAEQGFGDTIQFARFLQALSARGARVLFAPQAELHDLMRTLDPPVEIVDADDPSLDYDAHCPLLSLPYILGLGADDLVAPRSYLRADSGLTAGRRALQILGDQPRIGLVWTGSAGHMNDAARSMALQELTPLLARRGSFISLQKEYRPADRALLEKTPALKDIAADLRSFADTAAVLASLDLVVSVDTAVAHLAAALGKTVWLMLAAPSDWRWLRGRADSPWYPTVRLFRQPSPGDWAGVIRAVGQALDAA